MDYNDATVANRMFSFSGIHNHLTHMYIDHGITMSAVNNNSTTTGSGKNLRELDSHVFQYCTQTHHRTRRRRLMDHEEIDVLYTEFLHHIKRKE